MKNFTLLTASALLLLAGCKKDNLSSVSIQKSETIQGSITTDMALNANTHYLLKGQVYVTNNATLTVPAGTTIYMEKFDGAENKSSLVITEGAKLNVNGTVDSPVVFTSSSTSPSPGDWGAVVILGKSLTNIVQGNAEGLTVSANTQYGGNIANDNSGSLSYLRLEYCGGINPPMEDEWAVDKVSGLSLNGVGSGTKVDNVMVSHSNDDSFQFVGGTVNATHLIAYNSGDDDFDFDLGYEGKLQFLIGYRSMAPTSQALRANGIESYNDAVPTLNQPFTRPVISNITIIGPQGMEAVRTNLNQAVYIRKGTRFALRNSVIAEYPQGGLMVCPRTRPILLGNNGSEFKYNLVHSDTLARTYSYDTNAAIIPDPELAVFATNSVNQNITFNLGADLKLKAMYSAAAPDLSPADGSAALSAANFDGADFSSFFVTTQYRGAIGNVNWAAASKWAVWK